MKTTYRNGDYAMELSPNGNQWLVHKGKKCVATLDVEWTKEYCLHLTPSELLTSFIAWYHSLQAQVCTSGRSGQCHRMQR